MPERRPGSVLGHILDLLYMLDRTAFTTAADGAGVFPLPCAAFEKYMLCDDASQQPMVIWVEMTLAGRITAEELSATLPAALKRHPLLSARVQRSRGRFTDWIQTAPEPTLEILAPGARAVLPAGLDVTTGAGLGAWWRPKNEGGQLVLAAHHACCDGLALLTFIFEWLTLAVGDPARLSPASVAALPRREEAPTRSAYSLRRRMINISRVLWRRSPSPLALPEEPALPPGAPVLREETFCSARLTAEETSRLRASARSGKVSVNDWLLAVMFQTIHRWNTQHNADLASGPYRIVAPVSRREPSEGLLSACNKLGYKMLTRRAAELASLTSLVTGVAQEMRPVRANPQGMYSFLKMLRWLARLGLLHRVVSSYDCFATLVFSNVGDVARQFSGLLQVRDGRLCCGNVRITSIRTSPPRRANTRATIVALTLEGSFHVLAGAPADSASAAATQQFLDYFIEDLRRSLRKGDQDETSVGGDASD